MKKAILIFTATIVLVIITMLLCMLLFSSCDNNSNNENNKYSKTDRFVEIEHGRFNKDILYTTYYDKETLIMYMVIDKFEYCDSSRGITVMVDKDGKPLLYNKDKEKE